MKKGGGGPCCEPFTRTQKGQGMSKPSGKIQRYQYRTDYFRIKSGGREGGNASAGREKST